MHIIIAGIIALIIGFVLVVLRSTIARKQREQFIKEQQGPLSFFYTTVPSQEFLEKFLLFFGSFIIFEGVVFLLRGFNFI